MTKKEPKRRRNEDAKQALRPQIKKGTQTADRTRIGHLYCYMDYLDNARFKIEGLYVSGLDSSYIDDKGLDDTLFYEGTAAYDTQLLRVRVLETRKGRHAWRLTDVKPAASKTMSEYERHVSSLFFNSFKHSL